jgi:anhydro-N-acetylmuramic acid kinase
VSARLYVGLMSGTSMDAIDAALVSCDDRGTQLLHSHAHPISASLRDTIHGLSHSGPDEIDRLGPLDRQLGGLFGDAAIALLADARLAPEQVCAIGSHGQTIRHRPPSAGHGQNSFTLQIGDPNTIAERTGITTVADFRRRDMTAGGEGAPLAPAFHALAFGLEGHNRAIINVGGIANISLLHGCQLLAGFDCGPGNTLLDHWISRHRGERYDQGGEWGAQGRVNAELLQQLRAHPYFELAGPRSTGKEIFNLGWLDSLLASHNGLAPQDVQATLAQFTATTITDALLKDGSNVTEAYICGGGAHNRDLIERLATLAPGVRFATTEALGINPDWVEAALFGWLASRTLDGLAGNAPVVTGAAGPRILGAIYPASKL